MECSRNWFLLIWLAFSAALLVIAASEKVCAAPVAADSFNYLSLGGGTLNGRNAGPGWAGAWVTNGLGNYAVSGDATGAELKFNPPGAVQIDGGAEAVDLTGTVNQPALYRQLAMAQTNTFYAAYLVRLVGGAWTDTDTFSVHLANNGNNTSTLNFGLRGGADFMVRNGTGTPVGTNAFGGPVALNTTYFLVARLSKPAGSTTFDQIDMWLKPGFGSSNAPNTTLNITAGTGLASITHVFVRAAALDSGDVVRLDELKLATNWTDIFVPATVVNTVSSFSLMKPGNAGPVARFDPLTNGTVINTFVTGTNLNVRANTTPSTDFGSVVFNLTGATAQALTETTEPWALFGDAAGSYNSGRFNNGAHSLTATPYDTDGGTGSNGIALTINFSVTNFTPNVPPSVSLTNPANGTSFNAPAAILLEASAADSDGTVTNVVFYAGNTKLADDSAAPYSFLWTNVTAGAYSISAQATDNQGAVSFSVAKVVSVLDTNSVGSISGELKKWHKVSVTFTGPLTSETNANNPFRNYRLNVTFTHLVSGKACVVPGFFAADGDAANTSADSGDQWRVHFAPDEIGGWNYVASFRTGTDVATNASPTAGAATSFDGARGSFTIAATDKTGRDHRGKGRLQYVGKHHLRFTDTGEYFLKMGADAPENLLNYVDFDDQPPGAQYLKTWSPHAGDYDPADASAYTWKGGQGTNLLGAIKYLSDKGMNAFSFIPFNIGGDDKNVCPHRLKGMSSNPKWSTGVHHDRFDVSRMEQWERIFAYGDQKGMYLHFKTLENENQLTMDGGNQGPQRSLYYRELIARYGHHLALNWNLGEEINQASTAQKQAWSQYFYDNDPYHHHMVIHNMNDPHYDLLGSASHLTGFSLQKGVGSSVFDATLDYLTRSDAAGVPWVVALDEPGGANDGIQPDVVDPTHDSRRGGVIWAHVLAGGAGCESYFGYTWASSDLTCQDWRSRDTWWNQCRYALEFFKSNAIPFQNMTNRDSLFTGGGSGSHCFATNGQVYVAYMPAPATPSLNLSGASGSLSFTVRWFDPYSGGGLQTGSVAQVTGGGTRSLGSAPAPSTKDWVVLVRAVPAPPRLDVIRTGSALQLQWSGQGFALESAARLGGTWAVLAAPATSPFPINPVELQSYYRLRWIEP